MAPSKTPPPRIFENYVLTRTVDPSAGLTDILDSAFISISGSTLISDGVGDSSNVSDGYIDDAISPLVNIGFDFVFDQVTYKRMILCTNGWLALADPAAPDSGTVFSQVIDANSGSWQNEGINLSNSSQSVLIAPWADDLRNVSNDPAGLWVSITGAPPDLPTRINYGYQAPPISYNPSKFGVKIFREKHSSEGRRTIIRWHSLSNYFLSSTVLSFECVLYENGTIEFRYIARDAITLHATAPESATIGIFAPGTNRFRDFAIGLGYLDGSRQQYKYGGAVYSSGFTDSGNDPEIGSFVSRPYVYRLSPQKHWLGQTASGAIFRFSPPQLRRKILPRNLIREQDSRLESSARYFDDRRSTAFVSASVVNYPTTLPRFIGDSEPNVKDRQNLFNSSGNEFEITASIVKSAVDQFMEVHDTSVVQPFGEHSRFDQSPSARADVFYISGSGLDTGTRLDYPLWSKSQVRFSLPVNFPLTTFPQSASIYYYNQRFGAWQIPDNTTGILQGSDIASAVPFAINGRVIEDHKGFGPVGNSLTSGSNDPVGTTGTDTRINSPYAAGTATAAMLRSYGKSVSINNEYEATPDETININIDRPFLVEKAVFEIPFAFGPGWFADKTTSFLPIVSSGGSFDFAGPGLTVALYNQIKVNNHTRRDLIMTGTITHMNDMSASVVMSNFPSLTSDFQIRPVGYLAYSDQPGAVVTAGTNNQFTGSVAIKSEALISNGVTLRLSKDMTSEPSSQYPANRSAILNLIGQSQLTVVSSSSEYSLGYNIAFIDPFGRGTTGFDPSPRSILGKEFTTTQGVVVNGNKIANPFYLTGSAYTAISQSLASGNRFRAVSAIPLSSHFRSPYLVLPGDQLVLAIAKSRPFFYSSGVGGPDFSGSLAHDVTLTPGNINVTLYGSYVREGQEFHDIYKQKLTSDALREAIGFEPVLDEFEVAYRDEYVGGFSDDFLTGTIAQTIISPDHILKVVTGSRGRVFSQFNARSQPTPDSSGAEVIANSSKNFRLQPWWERVGTPRVTNHYDDSECFWDSLMPSIADAFARDGFKIFLSTTPSSLINEPAINTSSVGFVTFDGTGVGVQNISNFNWTKSFPYEPRYSNVSRQKFIQKSFVAKSSYNGTLVPIDPVYVNGLMIISWGNVNASLEPSLYVDADVSTNITGSLNVNETTKVLFGFGDYNNCGIFSGKRNGSNHLPDSRNIVHPTSNFNAPSTNRYRFGPIIRGWKYGVWNGSKTFNHATYRRNRYGQVRDMLEQRLFTKAFFETVLGRQSSISTSAVTVRFVDSKGNATAPENTQSQNLSFEATSSMPYFDGEIRNRPSLNGNTQNSSIVSFTSDAFNNVAL